MNRLATRDILAEQLYGNHIVYRPGTPRRYIDPAEPRSPAVDHHLRSHRAIGGANQGSPDLSRQPAKLQETDSSDVYVKGHKYRRYIFVWNVGARWIVATEQGGIALRSAIYVYRLGKDGKTARLIDEHTGFLNNVCGEATRLAKSVR
jgi:hypothetical protein